MLMAGAAFAACTDTIAVGDASLDKATSSTATIDSVFQNAEYTRQFLVGIYSKQYYGLPYYNGGTNMPHAGNPYTGKFDALTDCWHDFLERSCCLFKVLHRFSDCQYRPFRSVWMVRFIHTTRSFSGRQFVLL